MTKIRVTVWNEFVDELIREEVKAVYPKGIHQCIADFLEENGFDTKTATLEMPEHGLTEEVLEETDVLIWWGHRAHHKVSDEIVERVYKKVINGMGLIVLHSGHASKIFKKICGTESDQLKYREANETSILWVVDPTHPIADGLEEKIILDREEMYGEYFNIPAPDTLVFISWFEGGEVFRSGCCYSKGKGKIFYFQPGHEEYPSYHNKGVQKVICNAVKWAKKGNVPELKKGNTRPMMQIREK